ncbi:MAG TPA: aspartyl/asparaginyl beta-hydroxylase domain-containing protein [Rhodanobacteraceae bacterium]|nr:aspartyl/asparaginyl beta-hydroxylase domain-containing protein [Rhodanobacteraceae bacterium]
MLSIADYPLLDKSALIGGCARLDLSCDAARLRDEVSALPARFWGQRGGRVGVHNPAEAVFLRGHAPAEGALPIEDREALEFLPYVRELIGRIIPAPALRCLLALLPAGAIIAPHVDRADYFSKTIRVHAPVVTNAAVSMYCAGSCYRMRPGELWALNNSTVHGVINADAGLSRIHLICDFLPSPALLDLLARADRTGGARDEAIEARLFASAQSRQA